MAEKADNRRIRIYELDLTSDGSTLMEADVVYIPGFVAAEYIGINGIAKEFVPTLCSTIDEFEANFGEHPAYFEKAQDWPTFASNAIPKDTVMFDQYAADPSYVYAKELLKAGLPVVYERCNKSADQITVEYMYSVLNAATDNNIWEDLQDIGEFYEIKYLTSGGYPTFEYQGETPSVDYNATSNDKLKDAVINKKTFFKKVGTIYADTYFRFIWAYERSMATQCRTLADLNDYLPTAKEDERYYCYETSKLYGVVLVEGVRTWQEYDWKLWSVERFTTEGIMILHEGAGATLSAYGITFNDETVPDTLTAGDWVQFIYNVQETSPIVTKMLSCAANRGDCVALIDHTDNPNRSLDPTNSGSVFYSATNTASPFHISGNGEFGTMFTPYCVVSFAVGLKSSIATAPKAMPASFVYLKALAKSTQSNANWLAIAGASRGLVDISKPNLADGYRLSNMIAENYLPRQGIAINPITNIKPYGYMIWGNRTLMNNGNNLKAASFLNIRNIVSDIKKTAYLAARRCMFEQNSDILWNNYKARVTPFLDQLVSGSGLSGYDIIRKETTEKAKLACTIRIYPLYAVESFEIWVELADDEVTVS